MPHFALPLFKVKFIQDSSLFRVWDNTGFTVLYYVEFKSRGDNYVSC